MEACTRLSHIDKVGGGCFSTARGLQDSVRESAQKESRSAGYAEGGM